MDRSADLSLVRRIVPTCFQKPSRPVQLTSYGLVLPMKPRFDGS